MTMIPFLSSKSVAKIVRSISRRLFCQLSLTTFLSIEEAKHEFQNLAVTNSILVPPRLAFYVPRRGKFSRPGKPEVDHGPEII